MANKLSRFDLPRKDWYDNQTFGFRPLVCLKSNTQLQKVGDTTYQIK